MDFTPNIFAIGLLFLPTLFKLVMDLITIINYKKEVNHFVSAFLTVLVIVICSLIISHIDPVNFIRAIIFSFGIFALVFDYALNFLRAKDIFYIDQGKDGISSYTDRFYNMIGWQGTLFLKFWIFSASIIIYYFYSYTIFA